MITIYCGNCNKPIVQIEKREDMQKTLDKVKVCPKCGKDYVVNLSGVNCIYSDGSVVSCTYEHPKTPEPEKKTETKKEKTGFLRSNKK